jgi:hypothetical protein
MVDPEFSEDIENRFLDLAPSDNENEFNAGYLLCDFMKSKISTSNKVVQIVMRAVDFSYAQGFVQSLFDVEDPDELATEVGVACYWNDYHRLSLSAPIPDIAPLFRECHSLQKGMADIIVLVASGLAEPAAISGNLHRVIERTGAPNLLVVAPTATADEVARLDSYLYQDRIFGVRLLLGASPAHQERLRRLLPQYASSEAPPDSNGYPAHFKSLREKYSEFRQAQQPGFGP